MEKSKRKISPLTPKGGNSSTVFGVPPNTQIINQMKKIIFFSALALIGLSASVWVLLGNQKIVQNKVYRHNTAQAVFVKTAKVELQEISQGNRFLGVFEPNREINVLAEANGKVLTVGVQEGDYVGVGTLIAKIDDEMLRYQLMSAEANLKQSQTDHTTFEGLAQADALPRTQAEKAELATKINDSQVKQLQKHIRNTTIASPFAGVVTAKMFDLGSVVSVGTPLIRLTDIGTLKLVINVPEKDVFKFTKGQSWDILTDVHMGAKFKGTVVNVGDRADNARNYPIQIQVSNQAQNRLKAGMNGYIEWSEDVKSKRLAIPRTALVSTSKQPQVFVVEAGKAVLKNIVLGASNETFFEVLQGLDEGTEVVVSGQINLENGTNVKSPLTPEGGNNVKKRP